MLLTMTLVVNYAGMAAALWLGLYIVTRNYRQVTSWLASLSLWALASLFLNILFALTPPPLPTGDSIWRGLFSRSLEVTALAGANSWLSKWQAGPAMAFWYHVTARMRYKRLGRWEVAKVLFAYIAAGVSLYIQANTPLMLTAAPDGDPLYMETLDAGPFFVSFVILGVLYMIMGLVNLVRAAQTAPATVLRKQFVALAAATLTGILGIPVAVASAGFGMRIPAIVTSSLLGLTVLLIGFGVARYSALVEGRTRRRDFYYNAIVSSFVVLLYALVTWISVELFGVPPVSFIFIIGLAIFTHSLTNLARRSLDRLFYQRNTLAVRSSLRRLAQLAGEQEDLDESFTIALDSICLSAQATFGLILLFRGDDVSVAASCHWPRTGVELTREDLMADDILLLEPGHFPPPLTEVALLIPLYSEAEQTGALILGRPENSASYSEEDAEQLLYPSDRLADAIRDSRRSAEYVAHIAHVIEADRPRAVYYPDQLTVRVVEDALRHLFDYAYLGDHTLARLGLTRTKLPNDAITHIDTGKAVYDVLAEAIEKLQPADQRPGDPPPREWHPYLILHEAYIKDTPNRDIMNRLYISEGTFNRTRRSALRAVTRAIEEMEAALN